MQLTIEINNPYYVNGLEDMAQAVGLDVQTLAEGLIERQVSGYIKDVTNRKCEAVGWRLTERLNRLVAENGRAFDPEEDTRWN